MSYFALYHFCVLPICFTLNWVDVKNKCTAHKWWNPDKTSCPFWSYEKSGTLRYIDLIWSWMVNKVLKGGIISNSKDVVILEEMWTYMNVENITNMWIVSRLDNSNRLYCPPNNMISEFYNTYGLLCNRFCKPYHVFPFALMVMFIHSLLCRQQWRASCFSHTYRRNRDVVRISLDFCMEIKQLQGSVRWYIHNQ